MVNGVREYCEICGSYDDRISHVSSVGYLGEDISAERSKWKRYCRCSPNILFPSDAIARIFPPKFVITIILGGVRY